MADQDRERWTRVVGPMVTEQAERLTLKPVRVVAAAPEARREGNGLLELDLPSGTRLRFPAGTDPRCLQTLAAAL